MVCNTHKKYIKLLVFLYNLVICSCKLYLNMKMEIPYIQRLSKRFKFQRKPLNLMQKDENKYQNIGFSTTQE